MYSIRSVVWCKRMQAIPYFYKIQTLRYIIEHYVYRKITRNFFIFQKKNFLNPVAIFHVGIAFIVVGPATEVSTKLLQDKKDNVANVSVMYLCAMQFGDTSHFPFFVFFLSRTNWKVLVDIVLRSMGTVSESQFVKYCFLLSSTIDFSIDSFPLQFSHHTCTPRPEG